MTFFSIISSDTTIFTYCRETPNSNEMSEEVVLPPTLIISSILSLFFITKPIVNYSIFYCQPQCQLTLFEKGCVPPIRRFRLCLFTNRAQFKKLFYLLARTGLAGPKF